VTSRLLLWRRCTADRGGVSSGSGGRVDVGFTGRCSVSSVFGGATVVLLVAGEHLVLDEFDDVGESEFFPANAAS